MTMNITEISITDFVIDSELEILIYLSFGKFIHSLSL
jgi:hypothetical protein